MFLIRSYRKCKIRVLFLGAGLPRFCVLQRRRGHMKEWIKQVTNRLRFRLVPSSVAAHISVASLSSCPLVDRHVFTCHVSRFVKIKRQGVYVILSHCIPEVASMRCFTDVAPRRHVTDVTSLIRVTVVAAQRRVTQVASV